MTISEASIADQLAAAIQECRRLELELAVVQEIAADALGRLSTPKTDHTELIGYARTSDLRNDPLVIDLADALEAVSRPLTPEAPDVREALIETGLPAMFDTKAASLPALVTFRANDEEDVMDARAVLSDALDAILARFDVRAKDGTETGDTK